MALTEGNSGTKTATFTVKLSFVMSAGQAVSLKYNTANSTAVAPSDYVTVRAPP